MVAKLLAATRHTGRKLYGVLDLANTIDRMLICLYRHSNLHKDPTDAAQVPPSTMRQHVGDPILAHDDHSHQRERRHSLKTAQETHHGM
jgi:hypothetical protein